MTAKKPHRGVYILPNLFTTASLFAAFMCVNYSATGNFEAAAMAILWSALLDGLDGKVARLTNTSSLFGVEYDSLADVVAFGLAPAFLAWSWQLHVYGRLGMGISFIFLACAALRLARFNVDVNVISKRFFIGLPTPAGGCALALFVLFTPYIPHFFTEYLPLFALFLCIFIPLLMVSRVRYYSFKEIGFLKTYPFRVLVSIIVLLSLILSLPFFWGFVFIFGYILAGFCYTYIFLPHRNHQILRRLSQAAGVAKHE